MSTTTVNLGYVPKNRGEYSSTASYYKDNIVQYNGSSYICNPPNYDPDTAPTASITGVAPYASDPAVPNTGWAVFCNDSSGVGEGVYDVSVDHTTDNQPKKYVDLSAALQDVPQAKHKGGMTIRFIQSSDNKYVQFRYMSSSTAVADFTNVTNWQGVDAEIIRGSHNLVESGSVYDGFQEVSRQITGEITPYLTKGFISTTKPYPDTPSNYGLRTDFLEYPYNGKIEINSPYSLRYFYYDSQKVGLYTDTSFFNEASEYKYIRLQITGGEGRAETWDNIGLKVIYTNSLDDRLSVVEKNANYSQYDVLLEQGGFSFNNGGKTPTNNWVRTRYLTYNFIGKVSVGNGLTVWAFYYGQNKSHISNAKLTFTDGVCLIPEVQDAVYVAFAIKYTNSADIQPSDVTSLRLYPREQEQGEQIDVKEYLRSYALVSILNQGSLTHSNGQEVDARNYVRTPYIPYNALYKIQVNSGYIVHRFCYNDLTGASTDHLVIDASQGYVIPYIENVKYLRFSIQKTDTSADITPNDNIGLKLFGFNDYRNDEIQEKNTRNFINVNKNNLPVLTGCFTQNNTIGKSDFCSFVVTDLHGDMTSLSDTIEAKAYVRKMIPTKTIACICCGDICNGTPKSNGVVASEIAQYMSYAEELAIYHTMGQHEVGFYDTATGRAKANCFSHQEVFNTFISPMKTAWGLPDLDTIWYYKDITDSNVRIISLYQFNIPLVDDPSDSSLYKYWRCAVWYGQDQINWLIQTLNSTPSNYRVIILMHEPEAPVLPTPKKLFFTGSSVSGGNLIINGTPIYDIVSAYVGKTTLSQTYTCSNTTKYPVEDFTLSVNADFSQANGDFACFMTGDAHVDYMGVIENTSLINIGTTATSRQSYDITLYAEDGGKIAWNGNNLASSIVRCIGFCHSSRLIKVGGLGQQYSNTGEYRNYGAITY